jgi:hypothetical protein
VLTLLKSIDRLQPIHCVITKKLSGWSEVCFVELEIVHGADSHDTNTGDSRRGDILICYL